MTTIERPCSIIVLVGMISSCPTCHRNSVMMTLSLKFYQRTSRRKGINAIVENPRGKAIFPMPTRENKHQCLLYHPSRQSYRVHDHRKYLAEILLWFFILLFIHFSSRSHIIVCLFISLLNPLFQSTEYKGNACVDRSMHTATEAEIQLEVANYVQKLRWHV